MATIASTSTFSGGGKKSYCFGSGRENYSKVVYNTKCMYSDPIVPGPGSYSDETKQIIVNSKKYTMQPRTIYNDLTTVALKASVPGPGYYDDHQ